MYGELTEDDDDIEERYPFHRSSSRPSSKEEYRPIESGDHHAGHRTDYRGHRLSRSERCRDQGVSRQGDRQE